jgi:hypothetical protein
VQVIWLRWIPQKVASGGDIEMKPRGTLTGNLADVLHALQLARKTGLLVLERSRKDGAVEQGMLALFNGQITDADLGIYRGAVALEVLMKWGPCYFIFQASPTATAPPQLTPALPQQQTHTGNTGKVTSAPKPAPTQPPAPLAPCRLQQADVVLARFSGTGLSRTHRQLFLLIDGQRTPAELARLMGRSPNELDSLLIDLARARLIRL